MAKVASGRNISPLLERIGAPLRTVFVHASDSVPYYHDPLDLCVGNVLTLCDPRRVPLALTTALPVTDTGYRHSYINYYTVYNILQILELIQQYI